MNLRSIIFAEALGWAVCSGIEFFVSCVSQEAPEAPEGIHPEIPLMMHEVIMMSDLISEIGIVQDRLIEDGDDLEADRLEYEKRGIGYGLAALQERLARSLDGEGIMPEDRALNLFDDRF